MKSGEWGGASTQDQKAAGLFERLTGGLPRQLVIALHVGLFFAAYLGAVLLRFDFSLGTAPSTVVRFMPIAVGVQAAAFFLHGTHRGWMRYAGLQDLAILGRAACIALVGALLVLEFGWKPDLSFRSILLIDFVLLMLLLGSARFGVRMIREVIEPTLSSQDGASRLLIVGAGDTAESLIKEIRRNRRIRYNVVGLVDDNAKKHGTMICGVKVLGDIDHLPELAERHSPDEIIIATPTASGAQMRRIVGSCTRTEVRFRRLPALEDLVHGKVTVNQIRDVNIEDLLRREPVQLDHSALEHYLHSRTVLVTGAAGSIGSEICRQVARFQPKRLLLVERFENALFLIERELRINYPQLEVIPLIADVTDGERMRLIFSERRPEVVVHAAAHKHVPMMEMNPGEAIKNNVFGTKMVVDLAHEFGAQSFVLISTDKAVNPTSVMGATKRCAELYVQAKARISSTRFVAVRFGNVLGSNGSVVPMFQEQIRRGGPVQVTHEEMRRYFMTIPEASQLVLQAGAIGAGGEVFVLDMGEPVKIADLARDLIRLSGFSEDEIAIEFTGVRPGEKLFEELSLDSEQAAKTKHPKIWVGRVAAIHPAEVEMMLKRLKGASHGTRAQVLHELGRAVPEFKSSSPEPTEKPAVVSADLPRSRPSLHSIAAS